MAEGTPRSFAAVLDGLCRKPVRGRRRLTNSELARLVSAAGGDITDSYISHLRNGHRDNPTLQTIEDLAAALQVCPAVFVGGRRERRGEERPRRSLSGKLRRLFTVVYPAGRGPYTPEEAARAITDDGRYGSISSSYVRELLNPAAGTLPNPRLKHLLALADHFGLSDDDGPQAAYFLDDSLAAVIDAELDDYAALRDAGVVEFVTRMAAQAPQWTSEMRRQTVDAVRQAVQFGDANWTFPFQGDDDA